MWILSFFQSCLTVFKSLVTLEKTVERCRLVLDVELDRLVFQLHCKHGLFCLSLWLVIRITVESASLIKIWLFFFKERNDSMQTYLIFYLRIVSSIFAIFGRGWSSWPSWKFTTQPNLNFDFGLKALILEISISYI